MENVVKIAPRGWTWWDAWAADGWGGFVAQARRALLWAFGLGTATPPPSPSYDGLTDAELIKRLQRAPRDGRGPLYEALVRRHQAWLVRMLICLSGSQDDAEDLAQEVFVKAFLALDSFRGEANVRTWLRTIATRTSFNWQRDRKTARGYEQQAVFAEGTEWESVGPSYSGALMARDVLGKLLVQLSYPYREILTLRYLEEMDVLEIAKALDLGESAAKMRLKRAREQLEQLCQASGMSADALR